MSGTLTAEQRIVELEAKLAAESAARIADNERMTALVEMLSAEGEEKEQELERLRAENETLKTNVRLLATQAAKKAPSESKADTPDRLSLLMERNALLSKTLKEAHDRVDELEDEEGAAQQLCNALKAKVDALKTELETSKHDRATAEAAVASSLADRLAFQMSFPGTYKKSDSLLKMASTKASQLTAQLEQTQIALSKSKTDTRKNALAAQKLADLTESNAELTARLKATTQELSAAQTALSSLSAKKAQFEASLSSVRVELGRTDKENKQLKTQLSQVTRALEAAKRATSRPVRKPHTPEPTSPKPEAATVAYFKQQARQKDAEIVALRESVRSAEAAAATAQSAIPALREEKAAVVTEIEKARGLLALKDSELTRKKAVIRRLTTELQTSCTTTSGLASKNKALESNIQALTRQLSSVRADFSEAIDQYARDSEARNLQLSKFKQALDELRGRTPGVLLGTWSLFEPSAARPESAASVSPTGMMPLAGTPRSALPGLALSTFDPTAEEFPKF